MTNKISLCPLSDHVGIKLSAYQDFCRLSMELGLPPQFSQRMIEFVSIQKEDQKVAFLQQPNEFLGYETMLYMILNDLPFFKQHLRPLLKGRSEDLILDYFLEHFTDAIDNAAFEPGLEHKDKLEDFYYRWVCGTVDYNSTEALFLLVMLSFYRDVTPVAEQLYLDSIQPNLNKWQVTVHQKFEKLLEHAQVEADVQNQLEQQQTRTITSTTANARTYNVDVSNVVEQDKLYEEILYYKTNDVTSQCATWRRYNNYLLVQLLGLCNPKYDASKVSRPECTSASLFEIICCPITPNEAYLAMAMARNVLGKQIQYGDGDVICEISNATPSIEIACQMKSNSRIAGQLIQFRADLQVTNGGNQTLPVQITVYFPQDCYSELLEQEKTYDLKAAPQRTSPIAITENIYCDTCEFSPMRIRVKVQGVTKEFSEEAIAQVYDYHLLKQDQSPEAQVVYLLNATEQERVQYTQETIKQALKGQATPVLNPHVAETLMLVYPDRAGIEQIGMLCGLVHEELRFYCEQAGHAFLRQLAQASGSRLLGKLNKYRAQPELMAHFNIANSFIMPQLHQMEPMVENITNLLLIDAVGQASDKQLIQLAYLFIVIQQFSYASKVLERCQAGFKTDLLRCYVNLALGEIEKAKEQFAAISFTKRITSVDDEKLISELKRYFDQINGMQSFTAQFSVEKQGNAYYFEKQEGSEVTINLYQLNPFNYNATTDYSFLHPSKQFKTTAVQFQVPAEVHGIYSIQFICGDTHVKGMIHKSASVPVKVDEVNGVIQILSEKQFYVQVQIEGQFYKDGFTDINGFFDFFTVSDKEVRKNVPMKLVLLAQDGECDVIEGVVCGAQSKKRE